MESVFIVTHLHAGSIFNTAVFTDADKAKDCKAEWEKENDSDEDTIDLQECELIGEKTPSSVITIDVKQFIEDNLVDVRDMPSDNEIEQFQEFIENDLHDWLLFEWRGFTPEPSAAEYAQKERQDMGITE